MFTGIVQALRPIHSFEDVDGVRRLVIDLDEVDGLETGASVATNGTCLTVTGIDGHLVGFDVIRETLDRTNLGAKAPGDLVNIERSMRMGDEIGGHVVSGHVAGTAEVVAVEHDEANRTIWFAVDDTIRRYLVWKGFVAVDGASLTISALEETRFSVSLIPETIERTTLGRVSVGDRVNIEVEAATQATIDAVERVAAATVERMVTDTLRTVLADPERRAELGLA